MRILRRCLLKQKTYFQWQSHSEQLYQHGTDKQSLFLEEVLTFPCTPSLYVQQLLCFHIQQPKLLFYCFFKNFITFSSNINNNSTYIITVVIKRFSNKAQQCLQPKTIEVASFLLFLQSNQLSSFSTVFLIFPHRLNTTLKK